MVDRHELVSSELFPCGSSLIFACALKQNLEPNLRLQKPGHLGMAQGLLFVARDVPTAACQDNIATPETPEAENDDTIVEV